MKRGVMRLYTHLFGIQSKHAAEHGATVRGAMYKVKWFSPLGCLQNYYVFWKIVCTCCVLVVCGMHWLKQYWTMATVEWSLSLAHSIFISCNDIQTSKYSRILSCAHCMSVLLCLLKHLCPVRHCGMWHPVTSATRFCVHVCSAVNCELSACNSAWLIHGWSGFDYVMPSLSRCFRCYNAAALRRSRFNFCQTQFTWITSKSLHLKKNK